MIRTSIYFLFIFNLLFSSCQENNESIFNKAATENGLIGGIVTIFSAENQNQYFPFGLANYSNKKTINDSTYFRVASISKMVTAIAFMQLVDKNLVQLDDDVNAILEYNVVNPNHVNIAITPRMLLSHSSSLVDDSNYFDFLEKTFSKDTILNISELISLNQKQIKPLPFSIKKPGEFFEYSNLNYGVLATIIEKVSGQRFDIFCEESIFKPLSIKASFNLNSIKDKSNVATLYRMKNKEWVPQMDYPTFFESNRDFYNYEIGTNGLLFSPQGGLRINAPDLTKILQLFYLEGIDEKEKIISADLINEMLKNQWTYNGKNGNNYDGLFNSWGLGIHRVNANSNYQNDQIFDDSNLMFGHPAEAYGLIGDAYVDTSQKKGFIFLTNGAENMFTQDDNSGFYKVEVVFFKLIKAYF